MCTVSFVSKNGKTIITSNRDEKVIRPNAIKPKTYFINDKNIIFPKDLKAGGTWFAVDENATVVVLLNGAKEKHVVRQPYRKSRGLVVLDIISSISSKDFWCEIDLENIEPFTIVLFQDHALFQLRWDGLDKEKIVLDAEKNHIWSSATLYSKEVTENRSNWFHSFLNSNSILSETEILHFHVNTEKGDAENGLIINRNDELKTLSVTQAIVEQNKVSINHHDMIAEKQNKTNFITI